ncbi:MAG: gamma-glutamyltransferase [Gammaproteobacteria bacterium]|nr:gamma-glutamyltransferase [Gammaproteobacteria bacterium]|tara:strand:+ start:13039 stop:14766 length:1728 start_codon:yes stop_codon:yes gene_type:complete
MKNLFIIIFIFLYQYSVYAQTNVNAVIRYDDLHHPVLGSSGMVAAQNRLSAEAGARILEAGGNAIDAAIATGFSLAVTLPRAGNLGGGGFMLIHNAITGKNIGIDYREMAPQSASRDMYLDVNGEVDTALSRFSHLAAGVPGTVSGFYAAHKEFGQLTWSELLQPAIEQAKDGIIITHYQAEFLRKRQDRLCKNEAACSYFYKADGVAYEAGELFVQKDLANSLQLIADQGPDAFYKGEIADLIIAEMERGGGLIDAVSLSKYEPLFRNVVEGTYRDFKVISMPPPSSGGVHVLQMLNMLESFPISELGSGSADNVHLLAEVARSAFADRSKHLGDPDHYDVPIDWLTSKTYGKQLAKSIDMKNARNSNDIFPGEIPVHESEDTTHYSVIDKDGNVVSNTYTLNFSFGSGIAVPGAGFLLNNEMDDFSSKPGVMNAFGLLGGEANSIKAGKRPLSSMTPTIVFANNQPFFATGSPGGSRIITTVLQIIVNIIDHGMNLAEATNAPRMHHQWYPDVISLESGFSPDTIKVLKNRGHKIKEARGTIGNAQSVGFDNGLFHGASDTRRPGAGSVAPLE